jgi:uncharacterized protein YbdZ (MbtH family)
MKNPLDDESSDSFALINAEGQHSLWPSLANVPTCGTGDASSSRGH